MLLKTDKPTEHRFQKLIEYSQDHITLIDPRTKILYTNPAIEQMLGYTVEEYTGLIGLDLVHPEDKPQVENALQKLAAEPESSERFEVRVLHKNGGYVWVEAVITNMLHDPDIAAFVSNSRRIDERKAMQLELTRYQNQLEQLVQARTAEVNQEKERVEAILNNTLDGVVLAHTDLHIQQMNQAFNQLFGGEADAYFNISVLDLLQPEEHLRIRAIIDTVITERSGQRIETICRRKDGSFFEAELSIGHINAVSQMDNGLVCTFRDITERKHNETALDEERNLLRTLIDTIPDYIYIKDTQHRFVLVNNALAQARGAATPDALLGQTDFDHFPADQAAHFRDEEIEIFRTGQPLIDHEQVSKTENGGFAWASSNKVPLYNLKGELIGLVGITRDITERKIRERQLLYQAALQENISDAVIVTDLELRIQSWNRAAESIYGWSAEEVFGNKLGVEILQTHYSYDGEREKLRQELIENGQWHGEIIQHRKDGSRIYVLGSVDLFMDKDGTPLGMVAVNHDITERKLAEQALNTRIEADRNFQRYLKELQNITIELAQTESLDAFYKQVVEMGLARLEFDRMGLLLYDKDSGFAIGTYGTDAHGKLQSEQDLRFDPNNLSGILMRAVEAPAPVCLDQNVELFSDHQSIGIGWNAVAVLRQGKRILGWLAIDNGVNHKPLTQPQHDIFALYALAVSPLLVQKQTQAALRDSEEKFRLMVEHAPEAIIITHDNGEITLVNREAENVFGYSREELIGKSIEMLVPEQHRNIHRLHRGIYMEDPHVRLHGAVQNLAARHKKGFTFLADVHLSFVKTATETLVMSFVTDITERRQAEDALQKYATEVHDLYNNAPCGYHSLDKDGIFVQINDTELSWLGYTYSEVIGVKKLTDFLTPASIETFRTNFPIFKEQGWIKNLEFELIRKDGTTMTVLLSSIAIYDENHNYLMSRSTFYDITERKKAEEALRKALQREKELGEMKSQFISVASHEFRTPLTTILSSAEMLTRYRPKMDDQRIDRKLNGIVEQVHYLSNIIEDTLSLERMQAGRTEFKPVEVDIDMLCREIIEEYLNQPGNKHNIHYTCNQTPLVLVLDKNLMRRALSNIISNAVKYSPQGKPIFVTLHYGDDLLKITVRDQGIGIPEKDFKRLYDPFQRASNVGTISGTGLGLSITKKAIELHSGTIDVESTVGEGTVVSISIPV